MREITTKYHSDQRKHSYNLVEEPKKQSNKISVDKKFAVKVIMDYRTASAHEFRTRLVLKQYNLILIRGHSVLTKIISSFERENMKTQNNVLSYRIDLYFHYCKLAI